ncbi:hypothetical protein WNY78_05145 [Psychroserpens sp. AS72]|uniref:hypothetical protein n=1 Tax=Psychroserpens sp. AS72 TaxID=3135775 RepID=UPI00316CE4A2
MKKIALLLVFSICVFNCSDDETNLFNIQDKAYVLTHYIIENNVDLNADGIFSNDLLTEKNCFVNLMYFREDFQIGSPASHFLAAYVDVESEDAPIQKTNCFHWDGAYLNYTQNETRLRLTYGEELLFSGDLSENNTILTLILPNEQLFTDEFLYEDGTIGDYTGDVTAIYELVE